MQYPMGQSHKGFTLVEALIAMLVLTVGVMAVMLGFPRGLQSLEDSELLTQQSFYLYSTLERIRALCDANPFGAETENFQARIGDHPRDAWGNPDQDYILIIDNRSADRTVDVTVTNINTNVQMFGSLVY